MPNIISAYFPQITPGYPGPPRSPTEEPLRIVGAKLFLQAGCPSRYPTNSVKALKKEH